MDFLRGLLHVFIPRERTLLLTTFDHSLFIGAKSRLAAAGIRHRSKINGGMRVPLNRAHYGGNPAAQYEIFVGREDEHRALQEIQPSST